MRDTRQEELMAPVVLEGSPQRAAQIKDHTKEFLANGGEVQEFPTFSSVEEYVAAGREKLMPVDHRSKQLMEKQHGKQGK